MVKTAEATMSHKKRKRAVEDDSSSAAVVSKISRKLETRLLQACHLQPPFAVSLDAIQQQLEQCLQRLRQLQRFSRSAQGGYRQAAALLSELTRQSATAYCQHSTGQQQLAVSQQLQQEHLDSLYDALAVEDRDSASAAVLELQHAAAAAAARLQLLQEQACWELARATDYDNQLQCLSSKHRALDALLCELSRCGSSCSLLIDFLCSLLALCLHIKQTAETQRLSFYPKNNELEPALRRALLQHHWETGERPRLHSTLQLHVPDTQELPLLQHCQQLLPALLQPASQAFQPQQCTPALRQQMQLLMGAAVTVTPIVKTEQQSSTHPLLADFDTKQQSRQFQLWLQEHYNSSGWRLAAHKKSTEQLEAEGGTMGRQGRRNRRGPESTAAGSEPAVALKVLPALQHNPMADANVPLFSDHQSLLDNMETRLKRLLLQHHHDLVRELARSNLRSTCQIQSDSSSNEAVAVDVTLSKTRGMTVITPNSMKQQQLARQSRQAHKEGRSLQAQLYRQQRDSDGPAS